MSFTAGGAAAGTAIAPGVGTVIGAGMGLIGDIFSSSQQSSAQEHANQTNQQIAKDQMSFQERMSNTAYQRSMADMRAAGLNPILAYSKGGASTPSGASTTVDAVDPVISRVASSAQDAAQMYQSVRSQEANIAQTQAQTEVAKAAAVRGLTEAKTATLTQKAIEAELPARMAQSGYDKQFAGFDAWIQRIGSSIGAVSSGLGAFLKGGMIGKGKTYNSAKPATPGRNYQRLP